MDPGVQAKVRSGRAQCHGARAVELTCSVGGAFNSNRIACFQQLNPDHSFRRVLCVAWCTAHEHKEPSEQSQPGEDITGETHDDLREFEPLLIRAYRPGV